MARNIDIRLRRSSVPGNVPTVDQLNLGELAINTADGKLFLKKEYDGGIEQIIEVGAGASNELSSTFNVYIYTSDGTLQTIGGSDDSGNVLSYDLATPSRIQVYLNGVLLHQGIDYTATDGQNIQLTHPVGAEQVVQVSSYNSTGASFDFDYILEDGFSFSVGTDEETKFYHNSQDTYIKHMGYNGGQLKLTYRDSDRISLDDTGVYITGHFRLNGNTVLTDSDVTSSVGADEGSCLNYDESTGKFSLDLIESDAALNPDNSKNAAQLDGQDANYYRINVYNVNGDLVN